MGSSKVRYEVGTTRLGVDTVTNCPSILIAVFGLWDPHLTYRMPVFEAIMHFSAGGCWSGVIWRTTRVGFCTQGGFFSFSCASDNAQV